jgi:hypothetical protein
MKKNRYITSAKEKKLDSKKDFVSIIFLYDNYVYRRKSYGPIPLFEASEDKKIIDQHIQSIKNNFSNFEIVICGGFECDKLIRYVDEKYHNENIRIVENQLFEKTNDCESIRIALNNIKNKNVLIISALSNINDMEFKITDGQNKVYLSQVDRNTNVGANINQHGNVEYMCFGAKYAWEGIMWMNNTECIDTARKILFVDNFKSKLWFELVNGLIERNINISSEIATKEENKK